MDEIPAVASAAVQAADTSGMAEAEKRAKDKFIKEMSGVIVKALTPFRMKGCKKGFIKNNEDFKHLAKKVNISLFHILKLLRRQLYSKTILTLHLEIK